MLTTKLAAALIGGGQLEKGKPMKIEIQRQTVIDGKDVRQGDLVDTSMDIGNWFISKGWATLPIEKPKAKPKAKLKAKKKKKK